jgi:hypothetical protein
MRVHAINRSIQALTIDTTRHLEARREMLGFDALGEIEQQFQLPMEGSAGEVIGWFEIKLKFDVDFYNAPTAACLPTRCRTSPTASVIESAAPVLIVACVRRVGHRRQVDTVQARRWRSASVTPERTVATPFDGLRAPDLPGLRRAGRELRRPGRRGVTCARRCSRA